MSDKMIGKLRDDEKVALITVESREGLNMAYREDKKVLLLRDRLIEARTELAEYQAALGEILQKATTAKHTINRSKIRSCTVDIEAIASKHYRGGK